MAKAESKRSGAALLVAGKSGADEQVNGAAELPVPGVRAAKASTTREATSRRSTESEVYDDGTNTFFWRAHTLTVLFILTCALVYVTLLEETPQDTAYNTKRGIVASILVFLCFGVTQAKDGPFSRPHPAYWRFWLCVTVVYELFLIFILFQTVQDGRLFMKYIDPKLGVPLPERDYGGNCLIYDPGNTTDPFHNIWDKMDGFVPAHFLGWGKIKRIAFQFTPYSWVKFEWRPASNLRRWLAVLGIIFMFLLAELNTFYLKFVLWMPPEHYLVLLRLVFFVNVGGVAMREIYDFMDDPKFHKKLGQQAWLVAAITVTEFLIVVKYDPNTIMLPIPFFITQCWILGILLIFTWTLWRFFIRDITLRYKETRRRKQENSAERERPPGNSNSNPVTVSGRSKLNGNTDTVRHRKS
ncbi:hypothetical protein SRHO_G00089980 [Serrasalmus rhombeus]